MSGGMVMYLMTSHNLTDRSGLLQISIQMFTSLVVYCLLTSLKISAMSGGMVMCPMTSHNLIDR